MQDNFRIPLHVVVEVYAVHAILLLQLRERRGIEVVLLENDDRGQVSLEAMEEELATMRNSYGNDPRDVKG